MIHEPSVSDTMSSIDFIFSRNPFRFTEVETRDRIVSVYIVNDHHLIYTKLNSQQGELNAIY